VLLVVAAKATNADLNPPALALTLVASSACAWILVRRLSTRVAVAVGLACAAASLFAAAFLFWSRLGESWGPTRAPIAGRPSIPEFPWPPPAASAWYVADALFEGRTTVGDVVAALVSALEHNGYAERSFFRTEGGGVALVTRLERIDEDGSSRADPERWPVGLRNDGSGDFFHFLRGLFFVEPGHYRLIVFVLHDLPFSQSDRQITAQEAGAWLRSGGNALPPEIAAQPFARGHCTVLIYEFASDGKIVRVVESRLTGKQHLEKTGVLALLQKGA
jgi:hypothetical protein